MVCVAGVVVIVHYVKNINKQEGTEWQWMKVPNSNAAYIAAHNDTDTAQCWTDGHSVNSKIQDIDQTILFISLVFSSAVDGLLNPFVDVINPLYSNY